MYTETYGHFFELWVAKIKFLNMKPSDPAVLNFDQRMMWVPALHSANLRWVLQLFPGILGLTLGTVFVLWPKLIVRPQFRLYQLVFFYSTSLVTCLFFVRFHVYLSIFSSALLGWWVVWVNERTGPSKRLAWTRQSLWVIILIGFVMEARNTLNRPDRWGRQGVYYAELNELNTWLKEHVSPEPVLANFGVSASILGYGNCPIILHPKFETKTIRQRVQDYGETLFKKSEKAFRDWADGFKIRYYVYSMGEFSSKHPEQQMRYFVNALNPDAHAAARMFEFNP
ncbi:MAG: hypothetical protein GKR87_04485 [Kiritimatiellae bacterium]|nr:hypothetical protein [Kiritimatiellia bacterium]